MIVEFSHDEGLTLRLRTDPDEYLPTYTPAVEWYCTVYPFWVPEPSSDMPIARRNVPSRSVGFNSSSTENALVPVNWNDASALDSVSPEPGNFAAPFAGSLARMPFASVIPVPFWVSVLLFPEESVVRAPDESRQYPSGESARTSELYDIPSDSEHCSGDVVATGG